MKNMKRAYRRYKKEVHLKRRAKNYYAYANTLSINRESKCWADYYDEIKSGESAVWMRHTGKVCSCWYCSYYKYKRPTSEFVRNIINEQLYDI